MHSNPHRWALAVGLGIYTSGWMMYHAWCRPSIAGIILFNTTLILAVWSYLRTAFTDPGTRESPEFQEWTQCPSAFQAVSKPDKSHIGENGFPRKRYRWSPGESTICQKCQHPRPERAHHCRFCGACVLLMDHHCPLVANCVGWRNYKFFVLLNWWSCCSTAVYIATMSRPSALEAFAPARVMMLSPSLWNLVMLLPAASVIVALILCIVTGGSFIGMLQNASQNLTTIETMLVGRNPYRQPSPIDNLRQLLGPLDIMVFFPVEPANRLSGTAFPFVQIAREEASESCSKYGAV